MASEPLPPPPANPPSIPTTISDLSADDLLEIFLRLPNLPALARAAFTCRSWLRAVRSSPPFRRLFRALHPAPLLGLFVDPGGHSVPAFAPVRRSDPDVTAALRRGDFFLTSLPQKDNASDGWIVSDCREGYVLLWDYDDEVLLAVNPMTWSIDVLPIPPGDGDFTFLDFHLLCSDEKPSSFGVISIMADVSNVRVAIFSSETWDWVIHPWVDVGGEHRLKVKAGSLVDGSFYSPDVGEKRMIRINTTTMDISYVELPSEVTVLGFDFKVGETENGELCIVYASELLLHVWIRDVDDNGIESWVRHKHEMLSLSSEIRQIITGNWQGDEDDLNVVEVRAGYVYFATTRMTLAGMLRCWFFSLSLETTKLELLIQGTFNYEAYPYIMAWPPSLVVNDGSIGNEVEGPQ